MAADPMNTAWHKGLHQPEGCLTDRGEFVVPHECSGLRLDQVLTRLLPGLGRRNTRKSWEHILVLVDGQRQKPGCRVRAGQRVSVKSRKKRTQDPAVKRLEPSDVTVAAQNDDFAALVKPAGVHSQAMADRGGMSIEAVLPDLFPDNQVVLLNRLDLPVSGLLLAALHSEAAKSYGAWQNQGVVLKHYLAVVSGQVSAAMEIRSALDTAKRRKVRVLPQEEPDALRWTRVFPGPYREPCNESLVRVEIHKGRRHQIRAHLAAAGHPVRSDPMYGAGPDRGWINLHHYGVTLPGFDAWNFPVWKGWEDWQSELTAAFTGSFSSPGPWQNPGR